MSVGSGAGGTRRALIASAGLALVPGALRDALAAQPGGADTERSGHEAHAAQRAFARDVAAIQSQVGGIVAVAALDTGTDRWLTHHGDERMAMCSVFKMPLAACVLAQADTGRLKLDQAVPFTKADLVPYAPTVEAHLDRGTLSVRELCEAIVELSDNAAANLLLKLVGGPAALTAFLRRSGDAVTRLDRYEPELNSNIPGDPRDTSTPRALVQTLRRMVLGNTLSAPSREQLAGWLIDTRTGLKRLRAGLPEGWRVGDKTGTGRRGAVNDVAIAWPPGRAPILMCVMTSGSTKKAEAIEPAHAQVARQVAARLIG